MDRQDDEEYFNNLLNDLQYGPRDNEDSNYVLDEFDDDEDSIGLWEAWYPVMDEEVGMIVTCDDIVYRKEGK